MIIQDDFRRLVNEELSTQGMSRSELARRMGRSPAYVGDYLNGRNSPGPDVMEQFFAALGLTVHLTVTKRVSRQKKAAVA